MPDRISAIGLSGRFLRRDFRAGELHLLLIALVVAVSAIATVGFFVERLGRALDEQATQLLARGGLPATLARRTAEGWRLSGTKLYSTGSHGLS